MRFVVVLMSVLMAFGAEAQWTNIPSPGTNPFSPGPGPTPGAGDLTPLINARVPKPASWPAGHLITSTNGGLTTYAIPANQVTNVTATGRVSAVRSGNNVVINFDDSGIATGSPIYSVSGLVTTGYLNAAIASYATTNYVTNIVASAIAPLATTNALASAMLPLATTSALANAIAPLATTSALAGAIAPLVTTSALASAIAPLATTSALANAIAPFATTSVLASAIAPLATTSALASAVSPLATTNYVNNAVASFATTNALVLATTNFVQRIGREENIFGGLNVYTQLTVRGEQLSSNAASNGTFTSNSRGWSISGGVIYNSNRLLLNEGLTGSIVHSNGIVFNTGSQIQFSYTLSGSATASLSVVAGSKTFSTNYAGAAVTNVYVFPHDSGTNFSFYLTNTSGQLVFDNVTLQRVTNGYLAVSDIYVGGEIYTFVPYVKSAQLNYSNFLGNNIALGARSLTNISATSTGVILQIAGISAALTNRVEGDSHGARQAGHFSGTVIINNSHGAEQIGRFNNASSLLYEAHGSVQRGWVQKGSIGSYSHGAQQIGLVDNAYIGLVSYGAQQVGWLVNAKIHDYAYGAKQSGFFAGNSVITNESYGAHQIGYLSAGSTAIVAAAGAVQLIGGGGNETYVSTGAGSLLLGPGTNEIAYSVRAAGGFYGDGSGLYNITNVVSSISLTGGVNGAVTLVGAGITQNNNAFNFNGYLTSTSAAQTYLTISNAAASYLVATNAGNLYLSRTGGVSVGAINMTSNAVVAVGSVLFVNNGPGIGGQAFQLGVAASNLTYTINPGTPRTVWHSGNLPFTGTQTIGAYPNGSATIGGIADGSGIITLSRQGNPSLYTSIFSGTNGALYIGTGTTYYAAAGKILTQEAENMPVEQSLTITASGNQVARLSAANGGGMLTLSGLGSGNLTNSALTIFNSGGTLRVAAGGTWTNNAPAVRIGNNASDLTNFPASLLTVTTGNTNYWRITTAPTNATESGQRGQIAVSSSNVFIYNPDALGTGTGRWIRIQGSISWP